MHTNTQTSSLGCCTPYPPVAEYFRQVTYIGEHLSVVYGGAEGLLELGRRDLIQEVVYAALLVRVLQAQEEGRAREGGRRCESLQAAVDGTNVLGTCPQHRMARPREEIVCSKK